MKTAKVLLPERAVIVTTTHRGVFFGYTSDPADADKVRLRRCRMAVRWSRDVKGVLGLAAAGPTSGCRISPAADLCLRDITCVMECTAEAICAWEGAPWQA